ncbi:MAG: hypothetical protein HKM24_02370, partial [Gammaproteobacteria bacterium]|nr:hypothetical protein [Gammaproteobacteria bacterium]
MKGFEGRLLGRIDLSKYGELLQRLIPAIDGIEFCDTRGASIWSPRIVVGCDNDESKSLTPCQWLNQSHPDWLRNDVQVHQRQQSDYCKIFSLTKHFLQRPLFGCAISLCVDEINEYTAAAVADALERVCSLLSDDFLVNDELEELSSQLERRRDELNLVYDTEENVRYFDEGQSALKKLVRNVVDYLAVDVCALVLPDHDLLIAHQQGSNNIDYDHLVNVVHEHIYERLTLRNRVVSVNDLNRPDVPQAV